VSGNAVYRPVAKVAHKKNGFYGDRPTNRRLFGESICAKNAMNSTEDYLLALSRSGAK
jgi:hypothetical protein